MYNVEAYSPDELTAKVEQEQEETSNLAVGTLQWFLDDNRIGELYPREDVVQALSEHLKVDNRKASIAVSSVVGDIVDPIQQIATEEGKFVGIIDYNVYEDSGAYGYTHFDDRQLQRKRVVCVKCVEEADLDGDVSYAEQGEGTSDEDASWEQLLNKITSHYANSHSEAPEEIEPGAKLVSGTTVSGNSVFHSGNESNIDHNNLSNRTHSGDDLTPSSVSSDTLEASEYTNNDGFFFLSDNNTISYTESFNTETTNPGFISAIRFDHLGGNRGGVLLDISLEANDIAGLESISDDVDFQEVNKDSNWGTAGSTISIGTGLQWKIDDNDPTIAYLQVNADDFDIGILDVSGTTVNATPVLLAMDV